LEHLSREELILKALDAGIDQFGGESCPEVITGLVREGRLPEARLDASARRLLREKFTLGLFDDPYVDAATAPARVARPEFVAAGQDAQRASITVLTNQPNQTGDNRPTLPITAGTKLFLSGVDPTVAATYGTVVDRPEDADIAITRIKAPYRPRPGQTKFEDFFHAGSLDYAADTLTRILQLCAQVPTVVDIYLDRPAVIPEIAAASAALVADYGASDQALLDVIFGTATPRGRLPFDLPSSMTAVQDSRSDVPFDTDRPLFRFGHGLTI
jgi:beta-glucosidase